MKFNNGDSAFISSIHNNRMICLLLLIFVPRKTGFKEVIMGSKKLQVALPLLFAITMAVGMYIGYQLKERTGGTFFKGAGRTSLDEAVDLVRTKYVDPVSIDSISQFAIDEMLSHLDPHSVYIPASELKEVNEDLSGNFQGIGIEYQVFNDTVNVVSVIKDGPSDKAGVQVGDKIIKVNDSINVVSDKNITNNIRKYLRGIGGSSVKINIVRDNALKAITITRGNIKVSTIDAAYIIAPQTGYIKINKFGEHTYPEFMEHLEALQKQGMQKLILDLRGNPGGFMNEAVDIADEFLDDNKLVVYTQGDKSPRVDYTCKRDGLFEKGKLAVLVDETSASASEIVAGALQDWDRATIIGRRTFGKGLVQQQFNLSDGSAMRLTIARYYTPVGRNIQKPYAHKTKQQYQDELIERYHDGEVVKGDTSKPSGPAFKTHGGHTVYGGGGVTPDIFVAADTSGLQKESAKLYYKNTVNQFVYHYYIQNKSYFQSFKTSGDFAKSFNPGEKEWQMLAIIARKDSINIESFDSKDKVETLKRIKYLMARQIWRSEGYYEVSNLTDQAVTKALEILR